ncbi:DUF1028 domain-containing protein [Vreelandella venusta]|uniref:DUF1028 domain-containing protein n=1 Tax=Vreelandella venusta TaxID=44935 RepID=A0AAQ0CIV9_9GAMM|nr:MULTISPECIES: DUF1028 domain-containing protein [Halomonas]AZM95595.1 DUF1028 domain-containing protein [Halomonas venusta]NPT32072.1 hypothetical protein [Halomonas venusta]QRL04766.1 DUF1028 domain-containing protein [Halomonas venusta]WKD29967.1 DUF1028 domain-containing protein [Halomonas sp. KG2]GEK51245.1 pilus assembly protein [Halomonas venusta]
MTYSLIALDKQSDTFGIACATGGPALGGFVPHLLPGIGAAITQGFSTNVFSAEQGLYRLANGEKVADIISSLQQQDKGAAWRQVALMDRHGVAAGWTGDENVPVAEMRISDGLLIAGNMLASREVIPAMEAAYLDTRRRKDMASALIAALSAAQQQGGDHRGTLSAALKVRAPGGLPYDLRIDYAPNAITALSELHLRIEQDGDFQSFLARLPTADNPHRY